MYFQRHNPPPSALWKNYFQKTLFEWNESFSFPTGESFVWRHDQIWTDSIFGLTNVSSSNINIINLKLFHNHGGMYRFQKKFKKYPGEINPLGIHTYIGGWKKFIQSLSAFLLFSDDTKYPLKASLTCYFFPLLLNSFGLPRCSSELRKIDTLILLLMCLEALVERFSCFPGRDWKGNYCL